MLTIQCDRCKTQGGQVDGVGVFMNFMELDLKSAQPATYFYRPFIGHLCGDCRHEMQKILDTVTKGFVEKS